MKISKITTNAIAYEFDELGGCLTYAFLIEKENGFYLIDTFCGSDYMMPIIKKIGEKKVTVINTHSHWDHVWGNCCFEKSYIISHEKCRKLLDEVWEKDLEKNKKYALENTTKCLPNITFTDKLEFHKDGIEIFYSPGHTIDCISIFDRENNTLYVGDNLEKPNVSVEDDDIETYINTLKKYISYKPKKIMAGHTLNLTEQDILDTIEHLKKKGD